MKQIKSEVTIITGVSALASISAPSLISTQLKFCFLLISALIK